MKLTIKILKWISISFAGILTLIILSGLCYKLFSSKPIPTGKLVDVNGTKLHIRVEGDKNDFPTIVIEGGASCSTDFYHWIANGLKNDLRVIRYDREGMGYSELSNDTLTPEYYANQLHKLLEKSGENPPYILVGHSMGGPYNRIFRDLYPNEVEGLVFLDSSHPEQIERFEKIGETTPKIGNALVQFYSIVADLGILGLRNKIIDLDLPFNGLPEDCQNRTQDLLFSGKSIRGRVKEMNFVDSMLIRANETAPLDSLPILVFTAIKEYDKSVKESLKKRNIDPEKYQKLHFEMQQELKELSVKGKKIDINGNHNSIFLKKENAEIINNEIILMAKSIVHQK